MLNLPKCLNSLSAKNENFRFLFPCVECHKQHFSFLAFFLIIITKIDTPTHLLWEFGNSMMNRTEIDDDRKLMG